MKQKFYLVSAALLFGVSVASATVTERTYPVPDPEFTTLTTDGETTQYLYNTGIKGFLRGANNWQTRATICGGSGTTWKITAMEEGTYVLSDSVFKFSEYRNMFADGNEGIWVDNNSGANFDKWTITPIEGKQTFYIGNTAYAGTYLGGLPGNVGKKGDNGATDIGVYCNLEDPTKQDFKNFKYEWAAVTPAAYEAYAAKYPEYADAIALYETSTSLYNALVKAEAAGVSATALEAYNAVYNNTASTADEINAAAEAVNKLTEEFLANALAEQLKNASWSNPVEITSTIKYTTTIEGGSGNNDVKGWHRVHTGSLTNGTFHVNTWSTEGEKDGTNMLKPFIEDWNAAGTYLCDQYYYHDTIKVAPGAYKITANIRCYNEKAGAEHLDGGYLFANFNKANLLAQNDEVMPYMDFDGKLVLWKDPYEVYCVVGSDSALTFGVIIEEADFNWIAAKDFKVYALGASEEAVINARGKYTSTLVELDEDALVSTDLWEAYNVIAKKYGEAKTAADVMAAIAEVNKLKPAVDANTAAWKALEALKEEGNKLVASGDYQGVAVNELNKYLGNDLRKILNELELSTEDIYKTIEILKEKIEKAKKGLQPGSVVEIENYDFAKGEAGWTFQKVNGGNVVANASAKCAEGWNNSNFDIYQIVSGVPAGVYRITTQGFYRYKRDEEAWNAYFDEFGDKKDDAPKSTAYVYLNDKRTALRNVFEFQQPADFYTAGNTYADPLGEYVYPNDMTSAGLAFDQGEYKASAIGVVAHDGDSLRIGMKGNTEGDCWAIFTRFELVYLGYDADSIKKELNNELEKLNYGLVGTEIEEAIAKIKTDAEAAGSDGQKMFEVLSSLYALSEPIENSEKVFAELKKANEALGTTLASEELNAVESVKEEANTLYLAVDKAISEKTYTTDEAKEKITEIKIINRKLLIPSNINEASDEAPIELTALIENNGFEAGNLNGWTYENFQIQSNSAFGKEGTYYCERWHVDCALNISQTLEGLPLPAGTYGIQVMAHCSTEEGKVYINGFEETIQNISDSNNPSSDIAYCKLANDGDSITFGVKANLTASTWCCVDNFQLFYYGKDSKHETGIVEINENKVTMVEIFDIKGVKINALQKGINIVRTTNSNGQVVVKKISVK